MGRAATPQEKAVFGPNVEIGPDDKPIETGIGAMPAPQPEPEKPQPVRAKPKRKAVKVHPAARAARKQHSRHAARH